VRTRLSTLALTCLLVIALGTTAGGALPAVGSAAVPVPVLATDNVEVVGALPHASVVAVTFDPLKPVMYSTTLSGFGTYDIRNPERPVPLGFLPFPHFSNENIKLGVRPDGTRIVLAGFDLVGYSPQAGATNTRGTNRFVVIDVSDPAAPRVASTINTATNTHTMACANAACTHAYTAGDGGRFDVYDLATPAAPRHVRTVEHPQLGGNRSFRGGAGHDWDIDSAGVAWWVGSGGIIAFDVTDPGDPQVLNTSDHRSREAQFNRYIAHNSQRPDASRFTSRAPQDVLQPDIANTGLEDRDPADLRDGEVLFVTEEDLGSLATCGGTRGSIQAWHVQELDADRYAARNPDLERDVGTISPIGQWTTEMGEQPAANSQTATFCSAHYFDVHETGIIAQAWYQQGLRILDARDPSDIRQIGYYVTGGQEIFGAKWVPQYGADGRQTGRDTNLLYTEDPGRGIEILRVTLPEDGETAPTVRAPILPEWRETGLALRARAADPAAFGGLCLLR
jgi:hypothetical protein